MRPAGPLREARRHPAGGPDRGSATIAHVITIPIIVMVILTAVQLGMVWMAHNAAAAAVQNGISAAREYRAGPAAGRKATVEYLEQAAPNLVVDPQVSTKRTGDMVTVTVTATAYSIVPFVRLGIGVSESGPVERAVAS